MEPVRWRDWIHQGVMGSNHFMHEVSQDSPASSVPRLAHRPVRADPPIPYGRRPPHPPRSRQARRGAHRGGRRAWSTASERIRRPPWSTRLDSARPRCSCRWPRARSPRTRRRARRTEPEPPSPRPHRSADSEKHRESLRSSVFQVENDHGFPSCGFVSDARRHATNRPSGTLSRCPGGSAWIAR
jgi:hypothetical protein